MAEILHQLIGGLSYYSQGFIHPRWLFGISSINSKALLNQAMFTFDPFLLVFQKRRDSRFPFLVVKIQQELPEEGSALSKKVGIFRCWKATKLGGGFEYFLFSPLPGEMIHFDYCNIFQMGWNHQLENHGNKRQHQVPLQQSPRTSCYQHVYPPSKSYIKHSDFYVENKMQEGTFSEVPRVFLWYWQCWCWMFEIENLP